MAYLIVNGVPIFRMTWVTGEYLTLIPFLRDIPIDREFLHPALWTMQGLVGGKSFPLETRRPLLALTYTN